MKKEYKIYSLNDPRNGHPFYVGATKKLLRIRLSEHITTPCGKTGSLRDKKTLIDEIIKSGSKPTINLLRECTLDEVNKWERKYAFAYQNAGFEMLQQDRFNYKKDPMKKITNENKRIVKGYKAPDSVYAKAMKRATRNKQSLATIVEAFVTDYSEGLHGDYNLLPTKSKKQ